MRAAKQKKRVFPLPFGAHGGVASGALHRRNAMRANALIVWLLLSAPLQAAAQTVIRNNEILDSDRPEAWSMNYFVASSLLTSTGEAPSLESGQWMVGLDIAQVPRLSDDEQRVGFNGVKQEDLNRSPVFGRVRAWVGLPAGWVGEIGYTPPLRIEDTQPRHFLALAIGRRLLARGPFTLSWRVFGQHGDVEGDITCPARLAGIDDFTVNPYGCHAPSQDVASLNDYGTDLTWAWSARPWQWYVETAVVRTETQVQVDAYTYDVHDRSRLVAHDVLPFVAAGVQREIGTRWAWDAEVLFVPLTVRWSAGAPSQRDDFLDLRFQLRYRF
jgi:hypothetical protein